MKILLKEVGALFESNQTHTKTDREVSQWLEGAKTVRSMTKIPGDAGTRSYYRLELKGGDPGSLILMKRDPFLDQGEQLAFIEVQKHLARNQVAVPEVFDTDPQKGIIILEDLGDVTLLRRLQTVSDMEVERSLYQSVIDELVKLQIRATPNENERDPIEAFRLCFDLKKLMWEVRFTIEHFYEKHLSRKIQKSDREIMEKSLEAICTELADEPRVFTHRDFHSRNIMVCGESEERFVFIDFQDARMGPAQYDLVSLLKDSYYQLEERQVQTLIDYYLEARQREEGEALDRDHFLRVFDLMTIQRNFKAIGSFASFLNRRGNATYLKFIGNTFENIRRVLLRRPEYSDLREVFFHYYYF